ncbi:MAG: hypothetical protein JWN30_448 [Bacilli bacterium]|nr:hypothetical protein [Bacilli bacterium]
MRRYLIGTVLITIAAFVLITVTALTLFTTFSKGFDPSKLEQATKPTVVEDVSNKTAFQIQPPGPQTTALSDIPLNLQHGLIAIEDTRYYENNGIDFRSVLRALYVDVTHGSAVQGASTIPEQLAKIVYMQDEKTMTRKIKQIVYGIDIERSFTKDQILDFYLNQVYLGHGATGVDAAARVYFNKPVSQLDLAQCALLAGLPQAPSYYDPYVNKTDATNRRNEVLQKMLQQKYITDAQYQSAVNEPIQLSPGAQPNDQVPAEFVYYRDYLYEEADQLGISASMLANGGLTVYTSLNPTLQKAAYNAYQNPAYFPPDMAGSKAQSGAVFLDPKTGGIEALIGSRGTYVERGLDHATQINRSPGSSIKPLLVYTPAIQSGKYKADSLLFDGNFNQGGYNPHDWATHPTINGYVTLREALAMSWNVPAVWLLQQIGIDNGIASAAKAGLNFTAADHQKLGIALGDISQGSNPLQMADAYSAFANHGARLDGHAITKIVADNGAVIYDALPKQTTVMPDSTAQTMVGLLQNVVVNGIAKPAQVPGWAVAGKTGSTEYGAQDRDLWFCGFTPTVVGSIWMGFDTTDADHYIQNPSSGGTASGLPAGLFSAILQAGLTGSGQQFSAPINVQPVPTPTPAPNNNNVKDNTYGKQQGDQKGSGQQKNPGQQQNQGDQQNQGMQIFIPPGNGRHKGD